MEQAISHRVPAHLWVVGGLSLLWNAFGAFDYVMTQTNNADYLAAFTEQQRAYFDSFPMLMDMFWLLGVWGAVAGSMLLLLRSARAPLAFGISIVGLLGSTFYQFAVLNPPTDLITVPMMAMTVAIWAVALFLFHYARMMREAGALR